MSSARPPLALGRYELADRVAAGGMASIYLARQAGAVGFSRLVAVKRLHEHYANDPEFIGMFMDEARLAARVRHPNVVETLDVVHEGSETFIVLEYVDGESLAELLRSMRDAGRRVPPPIAAAIVSAICRGLHAAHEARGPDGAPLGIVHRDVSPQNVIVGADGIPRVTDFGIALARGRLTATRAGEVKGKPAYMAPEQISRDEVTRASDIYAAGVILWELCAGRRAYDTSNEGALIARVMTGAIPSLVEVAPWVTPQMAAVVSRALQRDPRARFSDASEMAKAIEAAEPPAGAHDIAAFVESIAHAALAARRQIAARLDRGATSIRPAPPVVAPAIEPRAARPISLPAPPPHVLENARDRASHTLTSQGPATARASSRLSLLVAFVGAIVVASALGVAITWIVVGRSARAAAPDGRATTVTPSLAGLPPTATAVSSSTEVAAPPSPLPSAALEPEEPAPSASTGPSRAGTSGAPIDTMARLPHRASSSTAAASEKSCDPPYYVDANGIRRVKRDCF